LYDAARILTKNRGRYIANADMAVTVKRIPVYFTPDPKRIIARFYMMGNEVEAKSIIQKILDLSEEQTRFTLNGVLRDFSKRHRNISRIFEKNFRNIEHLVVDLGHDLTSLSTERKLLVGSYFTTEYAIESAAFFNPSIVEDPDQSGLEDGQRRIIVSFRGTGEGHISSIVFRRGIIDKNNGLVFEPVGNLVDEPEYVRRHVYDKELFLEKLHEMNIHKDIVNTVMDRLGEQFIYGELRASIEETLQDTELSYTRKKVLEAINWVADSHYEISFSLDTAISERVIFPISYTESNGIEDARFVRFVDDDGTVVYYATYTAYNGYAVLPKLLKTDDFYQFEIKPIHGDVARNKGMALFPRKIKNKYAMLSRVDGINNYIMFSEDVHFWQEVHKIQEPTYPWELTRIGNAGSPLETDEGWLIVTHGVGPMRRYCLGALLLDSRNPTKVIAASREPILMPNEEERDGYVPNVVYSCGSIIHNGELIVPYGVSDYASSFASIPLEELFSALSNRR
jgi:predicted GH43/DUF377 family glycosyl hydrolase